MLDEPHGGLSPLIGGADFRAYRRAINKVGVGVLMVEQNAKQAPRHRPHRYVLATGRNRFTGPG